MSHLPRANQRADNRARDIEIRARAKRRSESQLADEFGLSQQRIHQIVSRPDPAEQVAQYEARLQAELAVLVTHHERNRRRIAVVRNTLDRIAEEREAVEIDRILGLA